MDFCAIDIRLLAGVLRLYLDIRGLNLECDQKDKLP